MAGIRGPEWKRLLPNTFWGLVLVLGIPLAPSLLSLPGEVRADSALVDHGPIFIDGDAAFTAANGVTGGNGTASNPYVIEGWEIDASVGLPPYRPYTFQAGIVVNNTTSPFVIRRVNVFAAPVTGIVLHSIRDARLEDVTVTRNPTGLELFLSTNVSFVQTRIIDNDIGGILMGFSVKVRFLGNNLSGNGISGPYAQYALQDAESEDVRFEGNLVHGNGGTGLLFRNTLGLVARNNTISGHNAPYSRGVYIYQTDPEFLDNEIVANDIGVQSFVGSGAISGNRVSGNRIGLWLAGSWALLVSENLFETNTECGLNLTSGRTLIEVIPADNSIVHNQFIANGAHVCGGFFEENRWDAGYPSGGNAWSGYEGSDFCSGPEQNVCPDPDGIGDSPMMVDGVVLDRYPLVEIGSGDAPFVPPFPWGTALAVGIPVFGFSLAVVVYLFRRRERNS